MKRRNRGGRWLSAAMVLLYLAVGGLCLYTIAGAPAGDGGETELVFPSAPSVGAASVLSLSREEKTVSSETAEPEEEPSAPSSAGQQQEVPAAEHVAEIERPVQISAHRGDSANWPENTLAAFQGAIDRGADWVELDVQASSDGELVVFHDDLMRRITGRAGKLWDYTAADLASMDAGAWMDEQFAGERIPLLAEVLELCRNRIYINIEIKENLHAVKNPITTKVVQLIEEYGVEDQCVVTAYMQKTLALIKELNPGIRTALLCDRPGRFFYEAAEVDVFSASAKVLSKELVENAHAAGKTVTAWAADTRDEVLRLAGMGVDVIMTSDPAKAEDYLYGENGFFTLLAQG